MATTDRGKRFHVVCRDCPAERLARSATDAAVFAESHTVDRDHRIVFERVA